MCNEEKDEVEEFYHSRCEKSLDRGLRVRVRDERT